MPIEFDGPNSKVSANVIQAQSGSTITIQSGHSLSGSGASLTNLPAANLTGTLPAISGASLTNLPAANLTGTLPAISGANLTGITTGKILQVVGNTTIPSVASTSSSSWVATNQYLSITPSATTSKVLIMIDSGLCFQDTANRNFYHYVTLYRDGTTELGNGDGSGLTAAYTHSVSYNDFGYSMSATFLDSPNTTSSVEYKTYHRVHPGSGEVVKYNHTGRGAITLMEIGA